MIIVAGAPGTGKSSLFPVAKFGIDFFNADDQAAAINGGSYHNIPAEFRTIINRQFEQWINEHIRARQSFAIETTLRRDIALQQATEAAAAGFEVQMIYIVLESFSINMRRVRARAFGGGHSAPQDVLAGIHANSLQTLYKAIALCGPVLRKLEVYDNSITGQEPRLVVEFKAGHDNLHLHIHPPVPAILEPYLRNYDVTK